MIPTLFAQEGWYTSSFIARRLGRPVRTVQHWCQTGFLIRRGCKVILIRSKRLHASYRNRRGEYWVQIPSRIVSIDAMLSKVPLDIHIERVIPSTSERLISRGTLTLPKEERN